MQKHSKLAIYGIIIYLARPTSAVEVEGYQSFCGCVILKSLANNSNTFAAQQLLQNLTLSTFDQEKCDTWTVNPDFEITTFATRFGEPTDNISLSAGVFAHDVYTFCGHPKFGQKFSFPEFSASFAGLLLPWIAIFAQLPRQTGSNFHDVLNIFISIGSPAWTSSSVFLAILFRRAVRTRFDLLGEKLRSSVKELYLELRNKCEAAKTILQAFVQAPVRLNPRPGLLSSLIVFPRNHQWWIIAANDIRKALRRVDAVFIVQIFIAALAWILAITSDFWSLPGSRSSASSSEWQICMGTLWLWLFVGTYGPVAIQSLYESGVIHKALASPGQVPGKYYFALHDGRVAEQHDQTAVFQASGLAPKHHTSRQRSTQVYEIISQDRDAYDHVQVPRMWKFLGMRGLSVEGDGKMEGLLAFPSRFLVSEKIVEHITGGFESLHDRLQCGEIPGEDLDEGRFFPVSIVRDAAPSVEKDDPEMALARMQTVGPLRRWDSGETPGINLRGSSAALDHYLDMNIDDFNFYPEWKDINFSTWMRFLLANLFGLVVQWGTSGPAIYVMYYSPPVGLGCDSGGLLIYAGCATISWLLLNVGNLFSHMALLHYQRHHDEFPDQSLSTYRRRIGHTILCAAAVLAGLLGKLIAVLNALWIITWSFLTYTNVMETPYCTTAYFSLRNHGWMRLWDFEPPQFVDIKIQELQCLVLGSFFAYFACVLIYALTSDGKSRKYRWIVTAALSTGFPVVVLPLYYQGVMSVRKTS